MARAKAKPSPAASTPLLEYQLFTNPTPIQVSSPQKSQNVLINNSVGNGGNTVYCNKIVIGIPKGTDSASLTDVQPTASVNTAKWTLATSRIKTGLDIGLNTNQQYFVFTFQTVSTADNKIDYDLAFSFDAIVNTELGNFTYTAFEFSGTTSDPNSFTKKQVDIPMQKTEQQFYLKNFVATVPPKTGDTSPQFLTEVSNGEPIRFSWESSGNYFMLFASGSATPIYQGTAMNTTVTAGITSDTTFFLVATASANPDGVAGGFEPIQLYDSLTLPVSNPDLTPKSVVSSGNISTGAELTTTGNATIGGVLNVKGNSTQTNGSFSGSLGVVGTSSLKATSIDGTLNVTGSSSLAASTISGLLTATGQVSMIGSAKSVSANNYPAASTDGFVVGIINSPGADKGISMGWIYGSSGGINVAAYGGNLLSYVTSADSKLNFSVAVHPGTFILPIKKGNTWAISANIPGGNSANPSYSFFWIPIGSDSNQSLQAISEADDLGAIHGLPTTQITRLEIDDSEQKNIDDLMELMQEILGKNLTASKKLKLRDIVKRLVFQEVHKND